MEGITEGRIVHYVLLDHYGHEQHRPAIVVRVWKRDDGEIPLVQLQVFTDGTNDGPQYANGTYWATSVHYSEEKRVGTWHWPEKA